MNLAWTAKEAAAKVRREGLRLDLRRAVATFAAEGDGPWLPVLVRWEPGLATSGWWRAGGGFVATVVTMPAAGPPVALDEHAGRFGEATADVHGTPAAEAAPGA